MNFYKHHLGDYARDTGHLSWMEDAAYTRLLRVYYLRERPIPLDFKEATRLVRAVTRKEKEVVRLVLNEFFVQESDGYHNKRADQEIEQYQAQALTNKRIAQARIVQRNVNESLTKGTPSQNQIPEPDKTNKPPDGGETVFDFAINTLGEQGIKEKTARSFIGSLLRDWDAPTVEAALRAAVGKTEVKAYVMGVLREKPKKGQEKRVLI